MENNDIVTEVTEKTVEQPVEEVVEGIELTNTTGTPVVEGTEKVKKYDDEDLDRILAKKIAIKEAKLKKEYEEKISKYQDTENVLNTGLGTSTIEEANQKMREYYREQGITMPEPTKPGFSERELEILGKVEAEEVIELGLDEATKEADLLAGKGYQNLNTKEKAIFNTLASYLTTETKKSELSKNGIKTDILEDKEFKAFAEDFNPRKSIVEIYQLYTKTKEPKPEVKPIGSMASTETNKTKDFYTYDEMSKLTAKDLDDPKVMRAVELSLEKLYKEGNR